MTPSKVEKPIWRALRIRIRLSPRRKSMSRTCDCCGRGRKGITFPPRFPNRIQIGDAPDRIPEFFDLRESKASPTPSEYRFQSGSRSPVHREQGNPRSSSPLPAESSATALDVQLTEWTAYFASIACASHNWLSGQVTLPWFKSSDFAAAESSW